MFELTGTTYAEFAVSYELGYASVLIEQPGNTTLSIDFSPAFWDSAYWDAFIFDGVSLTPSELELVGTAENLSLKITSNSDYFGAARLSGAIVHYTPRRNLR